MCGESEKAHALRARHLYVGKGTMNSRPSLVVFVISGIYYIVTVMYVYVLISLSLLTSLSASSQTYSRSRILFGLSNLRAVYAVEVVDYVLALEELTLSVGVHEEGHLETQLGLGLGLGLGIG